MRCTLLNTIARNPFDPYHGVRVHDARVESVVTVCVLVKMLRSFYTGARGGSGSGARRWLG